MDESCTPVLVRPEVELHPLSRAHVGDLCDAVTDGHLWRLPYANVPSPATMEADLVARLAEQDAGRMAPWAVVDPHTRRAVGVTCYLNLEPAHRRLEIGATWYAASVQGTAINPAAKLLLLTRAFDDLGCLAVELRTHAANQRSRAAIRALGARQDGILRQHRVMPDGSLRDTVVHSILDSEWPRVRDGLVARLAR